MLFNSIEYLFFLAIFYFFYWFLTNKNLQVQNLLILIASYIFYGWWDWRFLSLIIISTLIDYFVGLKIFNSKSNGTKKKYLWISIFFNISILALFKYFNFFIESFIDLLNIIGYTSVNFWSLSVILPVGISFYTFQTMSYSLDIYKNKLIPTKDIISFASFVSFFPQLVAGPIERASNLLPQILKRRTFNYIQSTDGLRLILWGLFKKVYIADSLGLYVNIIFDNYNSFDGGILILGVIYFSFQIYCDFSGYSDIAIGTSKLFGFELMSNFKFPYFSKDIGDFWKRWHISLSSWFRDYVYIPLGGSRLSKKKSIRNVFIIFILSGFWHGSNWTFIVWGLLHSIFYIPLFIKKEIISKKVNTKLKNKSFYISGLNILKIIRTYLIVTFCWIFFRSNTIYDAFIYISIIIFKFKIPQEFRYGLIYVFILIVLDFLWKSNERKPLYFDNKLIRWLFYYVIIILTLYQSNGEQQFIYFQF